MNFCIFTNRANQPTLVARCFSRRSAFVVLLMGSTPTILYFWPSSLQSGPTAHSAGFFLMKVRTACPISTAEVTINARAFRAE